MPGADQLLRSGRGAYGVEPPEVNPVGSSRSWRASSSSSCRISVQGPSATIRLADWAEEVLLDNPGPMRYREIAAEIRGRGFHLLRLPTGRVPRALPSVR
jgi:hypothetical protein